MYSLSLMTQIRNRILKKIWISPSKIILLVIFSPISYGATRNPTPRKNNLPITPDSYCSSQEEFQKKLKQSITAELSLLCQGGKATTLFSTMVSTAYDGSNLVNYTPIKVGPSAENPGWVDVTVAFSLRVKKTAVQILRSEEALVSPKSPFVSPDLNITFQFDTPTPNEGDADTVFNVKQRTLRQNGARKFDDTSKHSLKLYRLIPHNFDFLLAARTLIEDTAEISKPERLFKKATILRAAMTDPVDPKLGIVTTVMNFLISDQQGQEDRVENIFVNFIKTDILNTFRFHSSSNAP